MNKRTINIKWTALLKYQTGRLKVVRLCAHIINGQAKRDEASLAVEQLLKTSQYCWYKSFCVESSAPKMILQSMNVILST